MTLIRFFAFEPDSSIGRWLAWFVVTWILLAACGYALGFASGGTLVLIYTVIGVVFAKMLSESVRRLRAAGQTQGTALLCLLGIGALVVAAVLLWLWRGADMLFWADWVLVVLVTAALMLRPGRGRADTARDAAGAGVPVGKTGALVAAALTVGGALFGIAVMQWQAEGVRQAEIRTRIVPPVGEAAPGTATPPGDDTPRERDPLSNENDALSNQIDTLLKKDANP